MRSVPLAFAAAAAAVVLVLGCREDVTAPGSCPALCPSSSVTLADTTFTDIVLQDSSFRGYWSAQEAEWMVIGNADSMRSVALVRFSARATTWYPTTNDTAVGIGRTDSVKITLQLKGRDTLVHNVRLLVYRLPVNFDTGMTWATAQGFLTDSLLVDTLPVADSVSSGSVTWVIRTHALDTIPSSDGEVIGLAFALATPVKTVMAIAAQNSTYGGPTVQWFVHAPAPRDTLAHTFSTRPNMNTFTYDPPALIEPGAMVAGGVPSARALMRIRVPAIATDSLHLVRATLILTPTAPVKGLAGESWVLSARGVLRDFGAKSIIFVDTSAGGTTTLKQGDSTEIRIEVGRLLREWGTTSGDSLPRSMVLLADPEASGMGEVHLVRGGAAVGAPRLRVTYVKPYGFGVP